MSNSRGRAAGRPSNDFPTEISPNVQGKETWTAPPLPPSGDEASGQFGIVERAASTRSAGNELRWLGGCKFAVGDEIIVVTANELAVLRAAMQQPAGVVDDGSALKKISGVPDARKTFCALPKKYPSMAPFVMPPSHRGQKNGYRVEIRDDSKSK